MHFISLQEIIKLNFIIYIYIYIYICMYVCMYFGIVCFTRCHKIGLDRHYLVLNF